MILDALIILLALVAVVDFLASRTSIEKVQSKLIDYWIFIEELSITDELSSHVQHVRMVLQRNLGFIIYSVGTILISLAFLTLVSWLVQVHFNPTIIGDVFKKGFVAESIESHQKIAMELLTSRRIDDETDFEELTQEPNIPEDPTSEYGAKNAECEAQPTLKTCIELRKEVARVRAQRVLVGDIINSEDQSTQRTLAVRFVLASFAIYFLNALVYLGAFFLSVRVTLALLQSMERIRLSSIMFLVLDIALAIVIPMTAVTLMITVAIFLLPTEPYALLEQVNKENVITHLALYGAGASLYNEYYPIAVTKLYYSIFRYGDGSITRLGEAFHLYYLFGRIEWSIFSSDMARVARGEWRDIGIPASQRNWTIATSLGFSFFYIFSVLFLMIAKRSATFRTIVARILERVADYPRSPIAAISMILAALIAFIRTRWGA